MIKKLLDSQKVGKIDLANVNINEVLASNGLAHLDETKLKQMSSKELMELAKSIKKTKS